MYEKCLAIELAKTGLAFERQAPLHLTYDGIKVGHAYYADILVDGSVVVEVKAVDRLEPIHMAQMIAYLKLSGCSIGLMLNFNTYSMKSGIKRVVLGRHEPTQCSQRSQRLSNPG